MCEDFFGKPVVVTQKLLDEAALDCRPSEIVYLAPQPLPLTFENVKRLLEWVLREKPHKLGIVGELDRRDVEQFLREQQG